MTPFLQLTIILVIIIASARLGGYLSRKIGQSAVLGELLIGIILGPTVLDLLHFSFITDLHLPDIIHELAEIGVLLLMFLAGLELSLRELISSGKVAAFSGTLGVLFPLLLGMGLGLLFSQEMSTAIFTGLVLSATSVSISAQTLIEMKMIRSRLGTGLLGAAVFDDILVIIGLSIFSALVIPQESSTGVTGILLTILKMVLFLGISSFIGYKFFPRIGRWIYEQSGSQSLISFVFITILLYGFFAEVFGQMAAITGSFVAGLWFGRTSQKAEIDAGISAIAYGVFVPIFFINIGLLANAKTLSFDNLFLLFCMLIIAIIGKVLGAGWGAKLGGLTKGESIQLGIGMISRGEVGLIVASYGVSKGLIEPEILSVFIVVVITTTVLTPLLLRWIITSTPTPAKDIASVQEGVSE